MEDYRIAWRMVQEILAPYRGCFTEPGFVRFAEWVVGMLVNQEEHTITQALTTMGRESDWTALEAFAERGAWDEKTVEAATVHLARSAAPLWHGYRLAAGDDTKVHRTSKHVWGVNTFYEYSARCPNRATTVRAHNWVAVGLLAPGQPWTYLPAMGRLYFRRGQVPRGERFATKMVLAEEMLRALRKWLGEALLAALDGGFAHRGLLRGLLKDPAERVEWVTRLRWDARLYAPVEPKPRGCPGPKRQWGKRLPAPMDHARWPVPWCEGRAWVYGRERTVRWKELPCYWRVSGPKGAVRAFVFEVEGEKKPWSLVTSVPDLTAEQVVEAFAGRFRQDNGFRDLKQALGAEECRAWTKAPIVRTFQVQAVSLTVMRLLERRLTEALGDRWWSAPPWQRHKTRPSLRDVHRLIKAASGGFGQLAHRWPSFLNRRPPVVVPLHHRRRYKKAG